MTRKQAREQAFALVFEKSFHDEPMEDIIRAAKDARELAESEFAEQAARGVYDHLAEIDAKIEANIRGWKISRVSRVALAVMRLAVYEMLFDKSIPVSVSINEAVELAKQYGGPDDASYINGVLGSVARALEGDA